MKLYHYCSIESLLSIVKNEKIWFSDLSNSNDYLEDKLVFDMFNSYLINSSNDDFQKKVNELDFNELIKARNKTAIYGLCFTSAEDYILHWMAYGKENSVCIEFELNELNNYFKDINIFSNEEPYKVMKMKYVTGNLDECNIEFEKILRKNENIPINCYKDLVSLSSLTKLNSWKPEKEYRIIFRNFKKKDFNEALPQVKFGESICKFDYIMKNGKPVFHYEIDFDFSLIKSITIGPNSCLSCEELKNILSNIKDKFRLDIKHFKQTRLTHRK